MTTEGQSTGTFEGVEQESYPRDEACLGRTRPLFPSGPGCCFGSDAPTEAMAASTVAS